MTIEEGHPHLMKGHDAPEIPPLLRVDSVVKDYQIRSQSVEQKLRAVDDVTFSCDRAETVGIVGESGCGKTTLGRLVAGLIHPSSGTVTVHALAEDGTPLPLVAAGGVQMVYQSPVESLDPRMRIAASVGESLRHVRRSERRSRIRLALADVGLTEEHARKYAHELSGGQQQRACIARALIGSPSVVVFDEAVSSLDVLLQQEVLSLLLELQTRTAIAYLFISHDLSIVAAVSTRILVMYLGRVVEIIPAREFNRALLHPYSVALQSAQLRPRSDGTRAKPILLSGDPPSAIGRTQGCRFAGRCPLADKGCRIEEPALREHEANHFVACYHAGELVAEVYEAGPLDGPY